MTDPGRWFEPLADHAGRAYLRYSFTKGSAQETEFLVSALSLTAGMRVLDVGCGPGRHLAHLRRLGLRAVGVDVSEAFASLAAAQALLVARGDARRLPVADGAFDAVVCLCQGGFGLLGLVPEGDAAVLAELARVLCPGGRFALSAFSSYFAVRFLEESDVFDPSTGVNHERTTVKDEAGREAEFDLWTTCFTPRELRLLAERAGLVVDNIWSVSPGEYAARVPDLDHPEWLVVGSTIGR